MIKVEINNSECQITGLSIAQHKELKEILCYSIDSQAHYFSGNPFANKRYLLDKNGNFPTGLLYLVYRYLSDYKIPFKKKDLRRKPKRDKKLFTLTLPHTPYPEQEQAARRAAIYSRGIISIPTGVGKTLIAALIIDKLQVRTLIVVPSLELKRQFIDCFEQYFGKTDDITIENIDALDPNEVTKHDCVIIDEFHHSGSKTYRKLNKKAWSSVYYKFGLTATPFRSQQEEKLLLESVLSRVIHRVSYTAAVRKGYIVPVEAYYIEVPKTAKVKGRTWAQVYSELVVNKEARNDLIVILLNRLTSSEISTLCLVKEIAHGKHLTGRTWMPFVEGSSPNRDLLINQFNSKASGGLIGTTGVLGEGVDTRPAEYVIIAGLGKSKGQFMQQVGRGVRKYPNKESCKVIIFKDRSHKWTINHYNQQVKFLKEEYGIIPAKLVLY